MLVNTEGRNCEVREKTKGKKYEEFKITDKEDRGREQMFKKEKRKQLFVFLCVCVYIYTAVSYINKYIYMGESPIYIYIYI